MELSSLEDRPQAAPLGNMRRAQLANMHRRVGADAQAAYDRSASVQARKKARKSLVRQRWKDQLQLVQHVAQSRRDPKPVDESGMETIAQHVRAQDRVEGLRQRGQGLRRDMQSMARRSAALAFAGRSKILEDAVIVLQKFVRRWLALRMVQRAKAQAKLQKAMEEVAAALYGQPDTPAAEDRTEESQPVAAMPPRAQTAPAGAPRARDAPRYDRRRPLIEIDIERRHARRSALRSAHAGQRTVSQRAGSVHILTQLQADVMHRRRHIQAPPPPGPTLPPRLRPPPAPAGQRSDAHTTLQPTSTFSHSPQAPAHRARQGGRSPCVARSSSVRVLGGMPPMRHAPAGAGVHWTPPHSPVDRGATAPSDPRSWSQELQDLVRYGETVYEQFQRGLTPPTPGPATAASMEGHRRGMYSVDMEAGDVVGSVLDVWTPGCAAAAADDPAGVANVMTKTQQGESLEGLGECFRLLLGRYRTLWRHPETVKVDERDWMVRRVMGALVERAGEEAKPLQGRIVRSVADLSAVVGELDKARSPSVGLWRSHAAPAGLAAGFAAGFAAGAAGQQAHGDDARNASVGHCDGTDAEQDPASPGSSCGHRGLSEFRLRESDDEAEHNDAEEAGGDARAPPWQYHVGGTDSPAGRDGGVDSGGHGWGGNELLLLSSHGAEICDAGSAVAPLAAMGSSVSMLLRAISGDTRAASRVVRRGLSQAVHFFEDEPLPVPRRAAPMHPATVPGTSVHIPPAPIAAVRSDGSQEIYGGAAGDQRDPRYMQPLLRSPTYTTRLLQSQGRAPRLLPRERDVEPPQPLQVRKVAASGLPCLRAGHELAWSPGPTAALLQAKRGSSAPSLLREHTARSAWSGRANSRSDSLAHLNDSGSEAAELSANGGAGVMLHTETDSLVAAKERAVRFKGRGGERQVHTAHGAAALGMCQERSETSVALASSPPANHPCSSGVMKAMDKQIGTISSQQAAERAVARQQAQLEADNLCLSRAARTQTVEWLELSRLPGDPQHFDKGTRLRVATLSRSLLPCSLQHGVGHKASAVAQ
eukprot:jgi/Ulvmu1/233/UM001_0237.1